MELKQAVDNLCIYDPEFKAFANSFASSSETGGGNTAICPVSTMQCLTDAFNKYVNVTFVEFIIHGTPGMFYLANGTAMMGSYLNALCTNPWFLRKDARVLFENCSIGDGAMGDAFMVR